MHGVPLDDWANGGYVDVLSILVLSGIDLHTLSFLHTSLSIIQQEIFKKIVHVVHT